MDKQMAIEKLTHLATLKNRKDELSRFINIECDQYIEGKIDLVGEKVFAKQPDAPNVSDTYVDWTEYKPITSDSHGCAYILGLAALAVVGLIFLPIAFGWGTYFTVLAIGAGIVFLLARSEHAKEQKNKEQNELQKQSLIAPFRRDMKGYEEEVTHGFQQLPEYKEFYKNAVERLLQLISEWEDKRTAAIEELNECNVELAKIDFMPCEYFDLAGNILHMLESGRADTYKEALNMAIEEDRQEKLEQARREEENERLAAMERQAEAARKQAEEDRIRAIVDAKMQADRERDIQRKADEERKRAGYQRCRNCVYHNRCPNDMIARGDGLNCGRYTPS